MQTQREGTFCDNHLNNFEKCSLRSKRIKSSKISSLQSSFQDEEIKSSESSYRNVRIKFKHEESDEYGLEIIRDKNEEGA